jgi:5-methylcytosine-specific restriction endonuclease McrA
LVSETNRVGAIPTRQPFIHKEQNMSVLNRSVLVLNRNWLPINSTSVQAALAQMAAGAATALDIRGENHLVPVRWDDWINLEPLNDDEVIHTSSRRVRMPTVIITVNYDKIKKKRAKFTLANIARRDGGRCQYTGRELKRDEWSMDHVLPKSRGGTDTPDNVVLAHKDVNNRKGSMTPKEAGLPVPVVRKLQPEQPRPSHPHHEIFLKE